MRLLLRVFVFACVCACASSALAGPIADSIAFQGRLTDGSDNPVSDGDRDLILSIWSDSVGGTMLFQETRSIHTTNGLYSTCIGCDAPAFFDVFTDASVYLQLQLGGEPPMTPRSPLRYAPRSFVSARVRGDLYSDDGLFRVRQDQSAAGNDGVEVTTDGSTSQIRATCCLGSSGEDGVEIKVTGTLRTIRVGNIGSSGEDGVSLIDDGETSTMQVARKRPGRVKYNNITLRATADSTVEIHECDTDDDDVPDAGITEKTGPAGAFTRMGHSQGGNVGILRLMANPDTTGMTVDVDDTLSAVVATSDSGVTISAARHHLTTPGHKSVEEIKLRVAASGTGLLGTRDLDLDGVDDLALAAVLSGDTGIISTDLDSDGDGVPDNAAKMQITPTTSSLAIKTKGTGAQRLSAGGDCDDTNSSWYVDVDDDGDGIPERAVTQSITPTTASLAINTKGTGAKRLGAGMSCDEDNSIDYLDCDDDNDGVAEREIRQTITPTTASIAIKTKGTGADPNRVIGATDDTTATVLLATDSASISMRVRKGGNVKGAITINHASAMRMIDLDSDGNGYFHTAIGVGVDPTHPIEVAGGAYCDGTDWVNVSDANAKENFRQVDGAEILQKVEELPVSTWNYKDDPSATIHIGPTAQDFQSTFGMGSDGRSISTVDPSGVALAAIKELSRQNRELKKQSDALNAQNAELQKRLDELAAKLDRLTQNK